MIYIRISLVNNQLKLMTEMKWEVIFILLFLDSNFIFSSKRVCMYVTITCQEQVNVTDPFLYYHISIID